MKLRLYEGKEGEYSQRTCSIGNLQGALCVPTYNLTTILNEDTHSIIRDRSITHSLQI